MSAKRIAIIGAGPIGVEAALYARTLGHDVALFDRGDIAANVASWGFISLFTPWSMNVTPLGLRVLGDRADWYQPMQAVCPSGEELRDRYLLPLCASPLMDSVARPHTSVVSIGRDDFMKSDEIGTGRRGTSPFRILVTDADGNERVERADVVLDCSGTYGHHRWAGRGGIPAPGERALFKRLWYTIPDILGRDKVHFADRHTLLLGAGYSAATVLHNLETLQRSCPHTRVSWAMRRPGQALKAILDDPLEARRNLVAASIRLAESPPPWLQFLGNCALDSISRGGGQLAVTLRSTEGTDLALQVDEAVALVGYSPDSTIFEQLQVHQCYATSGPMKLAAALLGESSNDCLQTGSALSPDTLKNPEPGFFILGAKSYGTNSNFLLQVGHQQVRDAFRLIEGSEQLDLYAVNTAV